MINDGLVTSKKGLDFLKSVEKLSLKAYDDRNSKFLAEWNERATIGYGHLIRHYEWPEFCDGITNAQANEIFKKDVKPFELLIKKHVIVPLSQHQFDALVMLVFNIGGGAFVKSSVLKMINDPRAVTRYATVELAWKAFRFASNKESLGLRNRRNAEWKVWKFGIYERWKMRFRYYVSNLYNGLVEGTNNDDEARDFSLSEDYFVVDAEKGEQLTLDGDRINVVNVSQIE